METFDWGVKLLAVSVFSPLAGQTRRDFRIVWFSRCVWHSSHSLKSVARSQYNKPKAVKVLSDTLEKVAPADLNLLLAELTSTLHQQSGWPPREFPGVDYSDWWVQMIQAGDAWTVRWREVFVHITVFQQVHQRSGWARTTPSGGTRDCRQESSSCWSESSR